MTSNSSSPPHGRHVPSTVAASVLRPSPVSWIWGKLVPASYLTILLGLPGQGKSLLTLWLAARVSNGELGDASRDVILISAEDADTVVLSRLACAGADL